MFDSTFSNESYPILRVPDGLIKIKAKKIVLGDEPEEPKRPYLRQTSRSGVVAFVISLFILFVIVFSDFYSAEGIAPFILFGFVISIGWIFVDINRNEKVRNENEDKIRKYNLALNDFTQSQKERKRLIIIDEDENLKNSYFLNRRKDFFKSVTLPVKNNPGKKGITEKYLGEQLKAIFDTRIKLDVIIPDEYFNDLPYMPDFVYYDERTNLIIDIEVDEPYSIETGKAIHYFDKKRHVDYERDIFFMSHNWIVIRFAEEQVVNNRMGCCKFIAAVISLYGDDKKYLDALKSIDDVQRLNYWSMYKAEIMKEEKHRENYLRRIGIYVSQPVELSEFVIEKGNKIVQNEDEDDGLPF